MNSHFWKRCCFAAKVTLLMLSVVVFLGLLVAGGVFAVIHGLNYFGLYKDYVTIGIFGVVLAVLGLLVFREAYAIGDGQNKC